MRLPSASGIARAFACPASTVLPRADSISEDATRGTTIHAFLQAVNEKGRDAALEEVPEEYRAACEALDVESLPTDPGAYAAEVAFAYDVDKDTAREIGRGIDRKYVVSDSEIPGTADVVALAGPEVQVYDYKHGFGHIQHTPPAAKNLQLRTLALAACRAYGKERARVELVRLTDDGGVWRDTAILDAFDLDLFAVELRNLQAQIVTDRANRELTGAVPPATTGPHCRYCPSFAYCPSNHALARTMALAPEEFASQVVALLTPEQAGTAWARLKQAKAILSRIEEAIEGYARQTPVPLGDGVMLAPTTRSTERLDGKVAFDALAREFGEDFAKAACELAATKKAIEAAARGYAKKNGATLKESMERALEAIRKAGGVKVSITMPVVEHKPRAA